MTMDHSDSVLRKFIVEKFDDNALNSLCFDYFREVYHEFTTGMRKSQKARILLDYCQERRRMDDLLVALDRELPGQYVKERPTPPRVEVLTEPLVTEIVRNPGQVFLAHAHEDAELAHRLAGDLEVHGLQVWITPESIKPGEKWVEAISRGLDESGIFVLLLTKMALKSRWVRSETNAAIDSEHKGEVEFIPLQVEPTDVPPLWGNYQYISFQGGYEAGLGALLAQLTSEEVGEAAGSSLPGSTVKTEPATMPIFSAQEARKSECAECGKSFDSQGDLVEHEAKWHSATHQCPQCALPFKTKENLDTHILNWHPAYARKLGIQIQPLEFECADCGKRFEDQSDLEKHQVNWHSSKHQCPQCGLPFKYPGDLDQHIRNWHS
jgi:uncharacterized C2H2 Zn-finger protein